MAGTQTAGFDLVLQFSEEAYQELLGVFFDTSGLIPRLVDLIPGLEAEDFSLTVSLDRPTDVPLTPPAENPLDLRLVLGQGAAAATFRRASAARAGSSSRCSAIPEQRWASAKSGSAPCASA